ncbi:MAG: hypothetical protein ACREGB_02600, partial [Candidatus Saccharimonadales bacterium]
VITEGLAYTGEGEMANAENAFVGIDDRLEVVRAMQPQRIEQIGSQLVTLMMSSEPQRGRDRWLDARTNEGPSHVEVLGVTMVDSLVERGAKHKDLLLLPAEEFSNLL